MGGCPQCRYERAARCFFLSQHTVLNIGVYPYCHSVKNWWVRAHNADMSGLQDVSSKSDLRRGRLFFACKRSDALSQEYKVLAPLGFIYNVLRNVALHLGKAGRWLLIGPWRHCKADLPCVQICWGCKTSLARKISRVHTWMIPGEPGCTTVYSGVSLEFWVFILFSFCFFLFFILSYHIFSVTQPQHFMMLFAHSSLPTYSRILFFLWHFLQQKRPLLT